MNNENNNDNNNGLTNNQINISNINNFNDINSEIINNNKTDFHKKSNNAMDENEDLLKEFVGKNYDKITKRHFNFAGFFFTTLYMSYRKMLLFSLILFLLNVVNFLDTVLPVIVINLLYGLFINKIYLYYAKKKINRIKQKNLQKSQIEIRNICNKKGGTSILQMIFGFILHLIICYIIIKKVLIFYPC